MGVKNNLDIDAKKDVTLFGGPSIVDIGGP